MGKTYVYHSLLTPWEYYDRLEQAYLRYSLSRWASLMLLGLAITISLLLTQRRSWVILRYLGNKITPNPIAMPTDEQRNNLIRQHRSTFQYLLSSLTPLFSRRRISRSANTLVERNGIELQDYSAHDAVRGLVREAQSLGRGQKIKFPHLVVFGILAILNYVIWLALSLGIPAYLSYWPEDSPIVRSLQIHQHRCQPTRDPITLSALLNVADGFYRQCWLRQLGPSASPFCGTAPIVPDRPETNVERFDHCPWGNGNDSACFQGSTSVAVSQNGLFPRDLGINSPARLSINHRLVCSPINLEDFIIPIGGFEDGERGTLMFGDRDTEAGIIYKNYWAFSLLSVNGPSKHDPESSGADMYFMGGPWDFHVWPDKKRNAPDPTWQPELGLRSSLRFHGHGNDPSTNGTTFILGYRAGETSFSRPIDDPMFRAHVNRLDQYLPDYEMTAVECIEQYKVFDHNKGQSVSPWLSHFDFYLDQLWQETLPSYKDYRSMITLMTDYTSVYQYPYQKGGVLPLLAALHLENRYTLGIDDKEQWLRELVAWMEINVVKARYAFLEMVAGQDDGQSSVGKPDAGKPFLGDVSPLCNQILIRDQDSTNINAVGLWCFLVAQLLVVLGSYIDAIFAAIKTSFGRRKRPGPVDVETNSQTLSTEVEGRPSLSGETLVPSTFASRVDLPGSENRGSCESDGPRNSVDIPVSVIVIRDSSMDIQRDEQTIDP